MRLHVFSFLLLLAAMPAFAERVGIDAQRIFREHAFRELETKCLLDDGSGCLILRVLYQGRAVSRALSQNDFYLNTDHFGRELDIVFSERVSCRGGELIETSMRSHIHMRYCANRDVPILVGKTFLFLQNPGQLAVEFYPGKRDEFKRELARIKQTFTYLRGIMFRERELINSEQAAQRIAAFFEQHYAP